jgi:hypothetical protein
LDYFLFCILYTFPSKARHLSTFEIANKESDPRGAGIDFRPEGMIYIRPWQIPLFEGQANELLPGPERRPKRQETVQGLLVGGTEKEKRPKDFFRFLRIASENLSLTFDSSGIREFCFWCCPSASQSY